MAQPLFLLQEVSCITKLLRCSSIFAQMRALAKVYAQITSVGFEDLAQIGVYVNRYVQKPSAKSHDSFVLLRKFEQFLMNMRGKPIS